MMPAFPETELTIHDDGDGRADTRKISQFTRKELENAIVAAAQYERQLDRTNDYLQQENRKLRRALAKKPAKRLQEMRESYNRAAEQNFKLRQENRELVTENRKLRMDLIREIQFPGVWWSIKL
jgi:hypothetical protein